MYASGHVFQKRLQTWQHTCCQVGGLFTKEMKYYIKHRMEDQEESTNLGYFFVLISSHFSSVLLTDPSSRWCTLMPATTESPGDQSNAFCVDCVAGTGVIRNSDVDFDYHITKVYCSIIPSLPAPPMFSCRSG